MIYFDNRLQAICECEWKTRKARIVAVYAPDDGKEYIANRIYKRGRDYYIDSTHYPIILKYNGQTGIFEQFIPENEYSAYAIGCSRFRDDKLILIPQIASKCPILIFHLSEGRFTTDDRLMRQLSKEKLDDFLTVRMYMFQEECWGSIKNSCRYFRYRLADGQLDLLELENKSAHLDSVLYDGRKLWMTQSNSSDLVMIENGRESLLKVKTKRMLWNGQPYSWIVNLQGEVAFMPKNGDEAVIVKKDTGEMNVLDVGEDAVCSSIKTKSQYCVEYENEILILPWGLKQIYVVNKERNSITPIEMYFDMADIYESLRWRKVIREDSINDLFSTGEEKMRFYSHLLYNQKKLSAESRQGIGEKICSILTASDRR